MKIAFQTFPGQDWMGGVTAFHDLLIALRSLGREAPACWLITWNDAPEAGYAAYQGLVQGTIRLTNPRLPLPAPAAPAPPPGLRRRVLRRVRRLLGQAPAPVKSPPPAPSALQANGVDCTFSVVVEGRQDVSVPLLLWLYDFQYRHLPELFSLGERETREQAFLTEGRQAALVVVQSDSVKADVAAFLPELAAKTRRLRWVAHIPPDVYDRPLSETLATYHLPEKFFYLPNQFWMHKNHLAVFEALSRLHARGVRPRLVCSGSLVDHRRPDYTNEWVQAISRWGLREQVILLGVIPRTHVFDLMRQSVRVVNASLFEGFGLSVAECISLGKGLLLSDLPVLREQDPPATTYFDPRDPASLAEALAAVWESIPPGPDLPLEAQARAALPARQMEFGRNFMQVAHEAVELHRRPPPPIG